MLPDNDFTRLIDVNFTRFITVSWISLIWVLLIIVHILALFGGLYFIVQWSGAAKAAGMYGGPPPPPFWLYLVYPLSVAFSLLLTRMSLELMIVLFRNEANTRVTKEYYMRMAKEKNMELDTSPAAAPDTASNSYKWK